MVLGACSQCLLEPLPENLVRKQVRTGPRGLNNFCTTLKGYLSSNHFIPGALPRVKPLRGFFLS